MLKQAIITGGAKANGIGWATALAFAARGYEVAVTGVSQAEVDAADAHPNITVTVLDVRDDDAVAAFFARFERIDALVNAAGAADAAGEMTGPGFSRIIDINLTGTHRCCLAARDKLTEAGGAIVNVGSAYSTFGSGRIPGYTASKTGVVGLTRALAMAFAPQVRVNAVAPGWIRTAMATRVFEDAELEKRIADRLALERFGVPADVADPIVFLCSEEARYVTGVLLPIDGGYIIEG